jgi:hypothetical protein
MSGRIRFLWAGLLAAVTTAALVGTPAISRPASRFGRSISELTMRRLRLLCAALFAATATAAAGFTSSESGSMT